MTQSIDIKKTLNLPETAFSMKANLTTLEPNTLKHWDELNLYQKIRAHRRGHELFILHDGPPYANGNIHMGHAFNKVLKDFIVRSKTMAGYDTPYVPGWDCHGLPIEIKVDQNLGRKKERMSIVEIRQECRRYAEKYIALQRDEFKRLGVLGEWDAPYLTMSYGYEAAIARSFGEFVGKGYVYKGLRSVHWCIHCRTALAEAEVEYEDHKSPSVYVKFPMVSNLSASLPELKGKAVSAVIWTTTPWTLPANLGIAVNATFDYVAVEVGPDVYLVAEQLLPPVSQKLGWGDAKVLTRFKGTVLDRLLAQHPFVHRTSLFMLGDHVTLEQGTGLVHTAPGHGYDDYVIGQAYGLEVLSPVDHRGFFLPEVEHFAGLQIFKANDAIVTLMRDRGVLLGFEEITHSYPHCWRCHNPIIFRATPQWFIALDHENFRQRTLEAIHRVRWLPAWGEERIHNMVAERPDWCISRQRLWGVPIIAFSCQSCGEILFSKSITDHVADIFEKEGADAWYARPVGDLLPSGSRCAKCGSSAFEKENDILDVWFDSGNSHYAVLGRRPDLPWPSDMYMEGGDQYRGWFQSSLLVGVALRNEAPYRQAVTHGWTLDREGRAMSKSKGIGVEPKALLQSNGADIVRLLFSSVQFVEDIRIYETPLDRMSDAYRKIRNTCRYLIGNLHGFDPREHRLPLEQLEEIDRWAMAKLQELIERVRKAYAEYQFHTVYHSLYNFCVTDMSAFYLAILRDRLYTAAPKSRARRAAQTVLFEVLNALVRLTAPVLCFTAEEVWKHLRSIDPSLEESVHMALFPEPRRGADDTALLNRWERLIEGRDTVLKALETARRDGLIGDPLEARVILQCRGEAYAFLKDYEPMLRYLFITSQALLVEGPEMPEDEPLRVTIERALGQKCERCWNYSERVGENAEFPTICERCVAAIEEIMRDGE